MVACFNLCLVIIVSGLLIACGLSSDEIAKADTQSLCEVVISPANIDFKNVEILAELKKRSAQKCATSEIMSANLKAFQKAQEASQNRGNDNNY